jgi:hypothetical protein
MAQKMPRFFLDEDENGRNKNVKFYAEKFTANSIMIMNE